MLLNGNNGSKAHKHMHCISKCLMKKVVYLRERNELLSVDNVESRDQLLNGNMKKIIVPSPLLDAE